MNFDLRHKDFIRGLLYILGGIALLLHTFGLIQKGVNIILIILAFLIIGYGILKSGIYDMIRYITTSKK